MNGNWSEPLKWVIRRRVTGKAKDPFGWVCGVSFVYLCCPQLKAPNLKSNVEISSTSKLFFLPPKQRGENGWLGSGGDRSGAVRALKPRPSLPDTIQGKNRGVWQHANQWSLHFSSRHHLLRPHHHLPHCHRRSHPNRLAQRI